MAAPAPKIRQGSDTKVRRNFEEQLKLNAVAARKRRELFDGLSRFARMNGAWLISSPNEKWLRLEARPDSELPDKLHDAGFNLHEISTDERIEGGKFLLVRVFGFQIPLPR